MLLMSNTRLPIDISYRLLSELDGKKDGLTPGELAASLGAPTGTVRAALHHLKKIGSVDRAPTAAALYRPGDSAPEVLQALDEYRKAERRVSSLVARLTAREALAD